jgi:ABC-2 type transport system ATP-binding protein
MQQRVAIARTLLHRPRVLFFDEPTAALDPEAAKIVRDHLLEIVAAEGSTVLLCTHNLAEAERLCRRLSIVSAGRQVAEGTPQQLKSGIARAMRLRLRVADRHLLDAVRRVAGVQAADSHDGVITFRTSEPERITPHVVASVVGLGGDVLSLEEETVTLEDVYLALVKRAGGERGLAHYPA